MLFDVTEERAVLRESAERYAAQRYAVEGHSARLESGAGCDRERWREIVAMGWLATDLAENAGGLGLDFSLLGTVVEALAPGLVAEPFLSQAAITGCVLGALDTVSDDLVPRWLSGESIVALAHHESARASFYATTVASEFRRTAAGFSLNATKSAVLDGAIADFLIVSARDAEPPHDIALFVVPASCPALALRAYRAFDGRTLADIEIRAASLAATARLQPGTAVAGLLDTALARYVMLVAAESLGISRAVFELTLAYLNEREQFGQKLARFQVLQHRVADMQLRLTRAESLVEAAYAVIDAAGFDVARGAIAAARIGTVDNGVSIAEQAVQLHGGIGMTNEYILAHYLKRITANRFMAGERAEHALRIADSGVR